MTLAEAFADLGDPRTGPARRHNLTEMILMSLCAVLCGADTWGGRRRMGRGQRSVAETLPDAGAWHALP